MVDSILLKSYYLHSWCNLKRVTSDNSCQKIQFTIFNQIKLWYNSVMYIFMIMNGI